MGLIGRLEKISQRDFKIMNVIWLFKRILDVRKALVIYGISKFDNCIDCNFVGMIELHYDEIVESSYLNIIYFYC